MPGIGKQLDAAGGFASADLKQRLEQQASGFVGFVEKLRGKKLH
jgi:hypothetical protein